MNPLNVGLGVAAALIYAFLGYSAQDKPFNWHKFLRTIAIGAFSALGLDIAGVTLDVYTAWWGQPPSRFGCRNSLTQLNPHRKAHPTPEIKGANSPCRSTV